MHIYLFESDHKLQGQVLYCLQIGTFSSFFLLIIMLRLFFFKAPTCLMLVWLLVLHEKINKFAYLETDLSFSSHVKAVTKSAYYHLRNIARIRRFVSRQDLEKLVHAFITSRVDYCTGLLTGLPKKTIRQLQLIQNTAARILTRTRQSEHITPVLRSLHWLSVIFRIDFKVILLIYK